MTAAKIGYAVKYCFKDSLQQSDGRNSIFCSEGIGYHSKSAQEARKEHREENGGERVKSGGERYEYDPPTPKSAGHKDNNDAVTDAEKERFDRIAEEARTTTYTDWDSDHMDPPVTGTRYEYDPETGETSEMQVMKTADGREVIVG
jgi:hypothetical protein